MTGGCLSFGAGKGGHREDSESDGEIGSTHRTVLEAIMVVIKIVKKKHNNNNHRNNN